MNKKKPSGPVLTPALVKAISEAAAEKAIEAYRKEAEHHREEARDRRFHNTKLLLERFKGLEEHSKEAVRSASQVDDDPDLEELVEMMKGYDNRYEANVPSIMKSAAYLHTPQHQRGALSGSQGVPCESPGHLHRPRSLPPLQKREGGLGS